MKKSSIIIIAVAVLAVGGIAWWILGSQGALPSYNYNTNTPAVTPSAPDMGAGAGATGQPTAAPLVLNTMTDPKLGEYLVAPNGMTLYTFAKDKANVSNCTNACAASWPPYTVPASTMLTGGLNVKGTIATITRADGTMQITYKGAPLYFWIKDVKPGDTTGDGIGGVGAVAKP